MIIYNVTLAVEEAVLNEWLPWMINEHIPEVMATGKFVDYKMYKVLLEKENSITYSVQYFAENLTQVQLYLAQHAPELQAKHHERFASEVVAFRTVLEEI
jgi:Domain of unknown function (DUF4286)